MASTMMNCSAHYKEVHMRLIVLSFCLTLALATVGGCGIKPNKIDPPPSAKQDSFPKTYPATDPQPKGQNFERYVNP